MTLDFKAPFAAPTRPLQPAAMPVRMRRLRRTPALRALVGQRFTPRLATYPGPTLFLNGTYDLPFRLSVRAFAGAARQPRRVRLAGATHLANLDRPAAFNAAVRSFVRSLEFVV